MDEAASGVKSTRGIVHNGSSYLKRTVPNKAASAETAEEDVVD